MSGGRGSLPLAPLKLGAVEIMRRIRQGNSTCGAGRDRFHVFAHLAPEPQIAGPDGLVDSRTRPVRQFTGPPLSRQHAGNGVLLGSVHRRPRQIWRDLLGEVIGADPIAERNSPDLINHFYLNELFEELPNVRRARTQIIRY